MNDQEAELVFPMIYTCKYCGYKTIFEDCVCSVCTGKEKGDA